MTDEKLRTCSVAGCNRAGSSAVELTGQIKAALERVPNWMRTAVTVFCFAVMVSVLGFRVAEHLRTPEKRSAEDWGLMDFQGATYYPTVAFLNGVNPYDATAYRPRYPVNVDFSPYSPATLLVHLPFGLMPFRSANVAYFLFSTSLFLVLAGILLFVAGVDLHLWRIFGLATFLLFTRPGQLVLWGGQIVHEITIGCVLALHFSRRKPWLAGIGLALASLKPSFGIPLALLMLFRRDWMAVAIGLMLTVSSSLVSAIIVGANTGGVSSFIRVIWEQHVRSQHVPGIPGYDAPLRIDAAATFARVTGIYPGATGDMLFFCVCMAAAGACVLRLALHSPDDRGTGISALIICLATMASVYHMQYDALLLSLPFIAVIAARGSSWRLVQPCWRLALAVMTGGVLFNYFATDFAARLLNLSETGLKAANASCGIGILGALISSIVLASRLQPGDATPS